MQYSAGIGKLNLPELYQFGVELEAFNVHTGIPTKAKPSLYLSKDSKEFLKQHRWKTANILEESLVGEGGAECISPILHDKPEDWQNLYEVCEHMKKYPGKHGNEVVADEKCGCHVHFDARALTGKNIKETESITFQFLKLWAESEELIYKMCNQEGETIREGTLVNKQKGLTRLTLQLQHITGMASPTGKKIMKSIEKGKLKVSYQKMGLLKRIVALGKLDPARYSGLNLTNIGNPKKNTVEFRISNGTLDMQTIKQNVHLYASILETARTMALEPGKIQSQIDDFYKTDVTEEQKVDAFLELIFQNQTDRNIYKGRWESVKDKDVFRQNEKQFLQGRFQREDMKQIAGRTPATLLKQAFANLKEMMNKRENQKPELGDENLI